MAQNVHCHPAGASLPGDGYGIPADWLRPVWPAPEHVHALFTTRAGGASEADYGRMNLGDHVGDDPAHVACNRERLTAALQSITPGTRPVFLNQVHGNACTQLENVGARPLPTCDAVIATSPGLSCTVMVADCLPVLMTDTAGRAVGAAHAGWRGLAGGVLEALAQSFMPAALAAKAPLAIEKIAKCGDSKPYSLMAWLGPCIGPKAFEVGAEVRDAFCLHDRSAMRHFTACGNNKYLADLAGLARARLQALGVAEVYGNDSSDRWCTVLQESRFFSHRRDGIQRGSGDSRVIAGTGRMAACIWLS